MFSLVAWTENTQAPYNETFISRACISSLGREKLPNLLYCLFTYDTSLLPTSVVTDCTFVSVNEIRSHGVYYNNDCSAKISHFKLQKSVLFNNDIRRGILEIFFPQNFTGRTSYVVKCALQLLSLIKEMFQTKQTSLKI